MEPIHFKQQTDYTCGPACMRTVLRSFGINRSEQRLVRSMKTSKKYGTRTAHFLRLASSFQLPSYTRSQATLADVSHALENKYKVIILRFLPEFREAHYAIVKKITASKIYFLDPWYGPKHSLNLTQFNKTWRGKINRTEKKRWFFAVKKNQNGKV
jgi:ABC-type bacteriocin/lantibiotic exporter with double-glycine peptidase domain